MMELVNLYVHVACDICGKQITIPREDFDEDIAHYDHGENGMGYEYLHYRTYETNCPRCGNYVRVEIIGSEYPVGGFNHVFHDVRGCRLLETPQMGIVYYWDDYEIDGWAVNETGIIELIRRIDNDPRLIYSIQPREFEKVVEQLFRDEGFDTRLTPATRDGGKDIVATKMGPNGKPVVFYIECKRKEEGNKVDVGIVRELFGVQTADGIDQACLVTSSYFTRDAIDFANRKNVMMTLVDGNELRNMIRISVSRYTNWPYY